MASVAIVAVSALDSSLRLMLPLKFEELVGHFFDSESDSPPPERCIGLNDELPCLNLVGSCASKRETVHDDSSGVVVPPWLLGTP